MIKFELNRKGVADLMKSKNMQEVLKNMRLILKIKAVVVMNKICMSENRANARVWASSEQAVRDTYKIIRY